MLGVDWVSCLVGTEWGACSMALERVAAGAIVIRYRGWEGMRARVMNCGNREKLGSD